MATQPPGDIEAVRRCRARNTLLALVRAMLAGSGLDIRDRDKYLAISNPKEPDQGRIYISYTTGEVSWQRPSGSTSATSRATPPPPRPTLTPSLSPTPRRSSAP
jgi:hypothetical protein